MRFGTKVAIVAALAALALGAANSNLASSLQSPASSSSQRLSDDEIRDIIIGQSIASYSGSCPCPYSRARNGSRCGQRSAYSRPGGASPKCFRSDVSDAEVQRLRRQIEQ